MLAARLPGLLPPLSPAEALETSMVLSVAGELAGGRIRMRRAFRDPHHSATLPALIGGGLRARPGEASLAHNGVLFLDELPEFDRRSLEALRQPLESGRAVIARANAHVTYPARFQLVAAMIPRWPAGACRAALPTTSPKSLGHCSIASIFMSTCQRSGPPILPCLPRRKAPRKSPPASLSPAGFRRRVLPITPMPWPTG